MRTSKNRNLVTAAVLAAVLAAGAGAATAAGSIAFETPQVAFEQGLGAYKAGYYEIARPALEFAADQGEGDQRFLAEFYLARLLADNTGNQTNHERAYELYQKIANENADTDPDDVRRAPYVARTLTALADYVRRGLPAAGLKADPERATEYLEFAATFFNDRDAQFELAKVYLGSGDGGGDVRRGTHNLSILVQQGHAGAQAFLADLHWRGKFVNKDEHRALALATMAMENAPASERIWIEDTYQSIYCGASPNTRQTVGGTVAEWRRMFRAPAARPDRRMALGGAELAPIRRCANGEPVDTTRFGPGKADDSPVVPLGGAGPAVPQGAGTLRDVNRRQ